MPVSVNNDDDDGSGTDDKDDSGMPIRDNDLRACFPLGWYDGNCRPCRGHKPRIADTATPVSGSSKLGLWLDSSKSNAFSGVIHAGEPLYVEGLSKSQSTDGETIIWQYTKDGETHDFTNHFTVLSLRLFADLDFDGHVDSADKALHPALSHEHGWVMPVNSNAFRVAQLQTDVGLPGAYTLRLPHSACGRVHTPPQAKPHSSARAGSDQRRRGRLLEHQFNRQHLH